MPRSSFRKSSPRRQLVKDILYILLGVCIALILTHTGALDVLLSWFGDGILVCFVAGLFFTSAFTLAPASIALARLVEYIPIHTVAIWGALGALCGDLILFFFIRDRFAEDLKRSFKPSFLKHMAHSFHFGFLKWLSPVLGAIIIASPLPDELGLTLMGLSKTRVALLVPISFLMNMLGIYLLAYAVSFI